mmetsp:Transcript_24437/g.44844  ORF Transcript_24437/g.44844 Transcript_24437/m.44844 type:complete len:204 (-) Transcript_24437:103-714(-)
MAGTEAEAVPSAESKVKASIEAKGENSYYYAHSRGREDLSAAQEITGDGTRQLASLKGGPQKLDGEADVDAVLDEEVKEKFQERSKAEKIRWREDYAWGDDGAKVKIYLEFQSGGLDHKDCKVETNFGKRSFEVVVRGLGGTDEVVGIRNGEHELSNDIVPEKCSHRVSASKNKVTVTLAKADEQEPWSNLKKKNISQHTGWN